MSEKNQSRRHFMKMSFLGFAVLPMVATLDAWGKACGKPTGKALKKPIDEKTAKRLGYVAEAKSAKANTKGNDCGECAFYQDKRAEGDYAPCTMGGLKYVASCGWCTKFKAAPKKK